MRAKPKAKVMPQREPWQRGSQCIFCGEKVHAAGAISYLIYTKDVRISPFWHHLTSVIISYDSGDSSVSQTDIAYLIPLNIISITIVLNPLPHKAASAPSIPLNTP